MITINLDMLYFFRLMMPIVFLNMYNLTFKQELINILSKGSNEGYHDDIIWKLPHTMFILLLECNWIFLARR